MSTETPPSQSEPRDLQDLVLNLNFVPTWARQPADQSPYANEDYREAPPRRDDRGNRDRRPRPPRRERDGERRGGHGRRMDRRDFAPQPARLPIEISFIPEKVQLSAIVRQLHTTCRAYPLFYIAHLLLAKPDFHLVKVEARQGVAFRFFQCAKDGVIASDAESLRGHILRKFLPDSFDVKEIQSEAPAGSFVCVGRCRISGELLGPPNHHGFNERLQELHRDRFSHLPLVEYRAQIEMVRDPALIEQWKEQSRRQVVYLPKGAAADAPTMTRAEADAKFWADQGSAWVTQTSRAIIPARVVQEIADESLRRAIHEAWVRENRSPFKIAFALRPAFRRMRLHLFKVGSHETYVTAIQPHPIAPSRAVEEIAAVLRILEEHPGCTRVQLAEMLCPGHAPDSPAGTAALAPLRWLVERGHVIEFFNGTLSLPARASHSAPPTASESGAPSVEPTDSAMPAANPLEPSGPP